MPVAHTAMLHAIAKVIKQAMMADLPARPPKPPLEAAQAAASAMLDRLWQQPLPPGLHLVATPIGNLGDTTLRAIAVLARADAVFCEDTRVTQRLLQTFGIARPLATYHDHNAAERRATVLQLLAERASVALVSDAGTPLISDPGFKLAREAHAAGADVLAVPGPCAAIAALIVSGQPSNAFYFGGFLPVKAGARRSAIEAVKTVDATLIFYETGPRLADSLRDIAGILGPRDASIVCEATKRFERVRRDTLPALADGDSERGEIVLVIAPPSGFSVDIADDLLAQHLLPALERMRFRDAVDAIAAQFAVPKRRVYRIGLQLAAKTPRD